MGEYTMRLITMWPESKENFIPLLLNFTFDSNLSIYPSIYRYMQRLGVCQLLGQPTFPNNTRCVKCSVCFHPWRLLFFFKIPHSLLLFHLSGVDFPEVCCLIVPSLFGLSTEYSYNNVLMTTKYSGARTSTC